VIHEDRARQHEAGESWFCKQRFLQAALVAIVVRHGQGAEAGFRRIHHRLVSIAAASMDEQDRYDAKTCPEKAVVP
jgi:hypothetical protein